MKMSIEMKRMNEDALSQNNFYERFTKHDISRFSSITFYGDEY